MNRCGDKLAVIQCSALIPANPAVRYRCGLGDDPSLPTIAALTG